MILTQELTSALENIYISPLEMCNLDCQLCYTKKIPTVLSNQKIIDFTTRYQKHVALKSILFCGGEVFTLATFTQLVNYYLSQGIFVTIITNGTIDKLQEIATPNQVQLLVSLDGPRTIHDKNRGVGNFNKSIAFIEKAHALGFHTEVMYLVSPASYRYRDSLPKKLSIKLGFELKFNYLTLKTKFYTINHPLAQEVTSSSLTRSQTLDIKRNYPTIPAKSFGCYQFALQSNGWVYGCCESPHPIGRMTDEIDALVKVFKSKLTTCSSCQVTSCHGCTDPNFLCGYKRELNALTCQEVAPIFAV